MMTFNQLKARALALKLITQRLILVKKQHFVYYRDTTVTTNELLHVLADTPKSFRIA